MRKTVLFLTIMMFAAPALYASVTPENLELTFDGSNIIVDWDEITSPAMTEYYVFRNASPGITESNFDLRVTVTAGTSQYTDAIPDTYNTYYYTVQSFQSGVGVSPLAGEVDTSPYPPDIIYAPEPFNAKVFLRWEENYYKGVSEYNIFRATAPDLFTDTRAAQAESTEYLDDSVTNNTDYYYRIAAYSESGGQGAYSAVTGPVKPFAPPFTPKALTITPSIPSLSLVWTTSWQGGSVFGSYDIKEFTLYRDISPDFSSMTLSDRQTYGQTITAYAASDAGLSAGIRYYYKFMTADVNGNTSYPVFFEVFSQGASVPSAPQDLEVSCPGLGTVELYWAPNDTDEVITSYTIERATESSFDNGLSEYKTYSSGAASYNDASVETGAYYYYRVLANNTNGAGPPSSYESVAVEAAPVTGLNTGAGDSPGQIVISWSPASVSENISLYNVYRAQTIPGLASATPVPGAEGTTQLSYTDTGLAPGDFYYYQVASVTTTAGGPPLIYADGRRSVTAGAYAIGVPLSATLTSAAGFDSYVRIDWNPADESGATAYNVYRSQDPLSGYAQAGSEITNTLTTYYYDNSVLNGSVYYYLVTVSNMFGTSSPDPASSTYLDVTPVSSAAPSSPSGVTFTSAGDGSITLSWDPVGQAAYYNIYRSLYDPPDQLYKQNVSSVYNEQSMTVTDTASVTTTAWHYYRVRVVDTANNISAYSSSVSGTAYVRPDSVGDITLSELSDGVLLAWEKPNEPYTYQLSGYNIYRSTYAGGFSEPVAGPHPAEYFRDYAATGEGTYYYSVRTIDVMGNMDEDSGNYPSIILEGEEAAPAVLYARPGNGQVTLIWTLGTPEYYNIYRSTIPGIYGEPIATRIGFDNKEYVDNDASLVNGIIYYYAVASANAAGEGPKSAQASAMPYKAPDMPSDKNIYLEKQNKKDIYITWSAATGGSGGGEPALSGYNVYRSADGGAFYTLLSFTASTEYLDEETSWDNTYYYMVKTVDEYGNEDNTYNIASVELPKPENKLRVFANMIDLSKGEKLELRYFLVTGGKIKVSIHTLSGEFVKQVLEDEYTGELSEYNPYESRPFYWDGTNAFGQKVSAGIYYLIMELDGERIIEKVAVVK